MNNLITNLLHGVLPQRDDANSKAADAPQDSDGRAADFQDVGDESTSTTAPGVAAATAVAGGAGAAVVSDAHGDGADDADTVNAAAAGNASDGEPTKAPSGRHRADTTPDEVRTEAERAATHSAPHHQPSHQTGHSVTHATIAGDSALTSVGEYRKQRGELDTTPEHEHS